MTKPTPEEIRASRTSAGLSRRAAAELIGCSTRAWEDWEYGSRNCHPGMFRLFRLLTGQEKLPRR
jgi:DNA-binding transcriptional regulator YiaG